MTLQDKICEAGVTTLAELICEPCDGGGETVYVDSYNANIIEDVLTADIIDVLEADLIEEVLSASAILETNSADLQEEILTGEVND